MTAPQPSPGLGEFGLDLEKAREAVVALREVYEQLTALRSEAFDIARGSATAHDAVSSEAFDLLRLKAAGPLGSGSFVEAVQGGMDHVDGLIQQMEADISQQEAVDEAGRRDIERA